MTKVNDIVKQCVSKILDCDASEINMNDGLDVTMGWDSMAHLNILMCLEKRYLVEFTEDDFIFLQTVADITEKLIDLEG